MELTPFGVGVQKERSASESRPFLLSENIVILTTPYKADRWSLCGVALSVILDNIVEVA